MRRSTAISQVVLLLAFYVAPLVTSSSIAVPACCRRDGVHRCAMQNTGSGDQSTFSNAVQCPYSFPPVALTHATKLFLSVASISTAFSSSCELPLRDNTGHTLAQGAAPLDNRGPPVLTL